MSALSFATPKVRQDSAIAPIAKPIRQVAVLTWALKDGTETARETANKTVSKMFEDANIEVVSGIRVKTYWEEELHQKPIKEVVQGKEEYRDLPSPELLLKLGKTMGVQYVCVGRAAWHTKSVWVGLGPKTKAECTVDCIIVDVEKSEVMLDAKKVIADSTRKESGLETAGALLVSMGITSLSGGPKTPHQQRSAILAISDAMKPFVTTIAPKSKKIGDGSSTLNNR